MSLDASPRKGRPKLGFLGLGWIGRHRMKALLDSGVADVVAIADPSKECIGEALALAPEAKRVRSADALFEEPLDGAVIATPNALHASQTIAALARGLGVFCQKPLGRNYSETAAAIEAARKADRLLSVDLSYRHTEAMRRIRTVIAQGGIGSFQVADLVFHNAYGPDKPWFYDIASAGGGCVTDLGVHLVDLALWVLDSPEVVKVESQLFASGKRLRANPSTVEDFALATLTLDTGAILRLACSWRLHAGCDAEISVSLYGTEGGVSFRNVNGSFYDFVAHHYRSTSREQLAAPPDDWGGRSLIDWATKLARDRCFDPSALEYSKVAHVLDRIYGRV